MNELGSAAGKSWERLVVNWYPGHMNKATKLLAEKLPHATNIVEVRDARIPISSGNEVLRDMIKQQKGVNHVVLFNKTDLASPAVSKLWQRYYESEESELAKIHPFFTSMVAEKGASGQWKPAQKKAFNSLLRSLTKRSGTPTQTPSSLRVGVASQNLVPPETEPMVELNQTLNLGRQTGRSTYKPNISLVVGMPNVGKSTLINQWVGRKGASVAAKPAWTRGLQLFRIDDFSSSSYSTHSSGTSKHAPRVKLTPRRISLPEVGEFGEAEGMDPRAMNSEMSQALWILDSPGLMMPNRIDPEQGLKLALCSIVSDVVISEKYVMMAEYLHHLLCTLPHAPKPKKWLGTLGLSPAQIDHLVLDSWRVLELELPMRTQISKPGVATSSRPVHHRPFSSTHFYSVLDAIGTATGKRDVQGQAQSMVQAFRKGHFGPFSLEVPPNVSDL